MIKHKSVVQCFVFFFLIIAFFELYTFNFLIHRLNYTRRKADFNPDRDYHQDAVRLNINPPLHAKNLLVIHIGPGKTGTTSIQHLMAHLDATGILPKDNFYYLGKVNHEMKDIFPSWKKRDLVTPLIFNGEKSWFNPRRKIYKKIIGDFKNQFHKLHASQNHNVIMSAEEFFTAINLSNTTFFETLKQMIPFDQYEIHFIMMYRRYFEQSLSSYHYNNVPKRFETMHNIWPCLIKERVFGKSCQRARIFKTFREFYGQMIKPFSGIWDPHPIQATSLSVYKSFQKSSPKTWSINVVNMHHPGSSSNVVIDLLCGMGNVTANTCKYLQDINSTGLLRNLTHANVDPLKKKDDKYVIDYHLMAQYAHSIGSIHKNITRRQAEMVFQAMFRKWKGGRKSQVYKEGDTVVSSWNGDQDMTIPLACLSRKEQNDILKESENIESNLLPVFYNSIYGKDSLRQHFRKIQANHALCNIALDTLFQNDTYWVNFLDCLHKSALVQECL